MTSGAAPHLDQSMESICCIAWRHPTLVCLLCKLQCIEHDISLGEMLQLISMPPPDRDYH